MSYEPTNWKDGDLVTSAKLNKIEQGIAAGGGVLIVHDEDGTLDKTWQEIYDADACIIQGSSDFGKAFDLVTMVDHLPTGSEPFGIRTLFGTKYVTSSSDDYPTINNSEEGGSINLPIT